MDEKSKARWTDSALPNGTVVGNYRICGILGRGGFGFTYLVEHISLAGKMVLKEVFPVDVATRIGDSTVEPLGESRDDFEWAKRCFKNEAKSLAALSHANIVDPREVFEANGTAYMATSYEPGLALTEWLKREGKDKGGIPEKEILAILLPLLDGLSAVHGAGMLHRDIKPENIYMGSERPILIDFGSARQAVSSHSRPMTSIVASGYAPVEFYTGSSKQGPWSDIYSVAAVAHRMIVGKNPPVAVNRMRDDPYEPLVEVVSGEYTEPFLRAIDQALHPMETERPQSVSEWKAMLVEDLSMRRPESEKEGYLPAPVVNAPPLKNRDKAVINPKSKMSFGELVKYGTGKAIGGLKSKLGLDKTREAANSRIPDSSSSKNVCFAGLVKDAARAGRSFILDVWAFLPEQRAQVMELAEMAGRSKSAGLASAEVENLEPGMQIDFSVSSNDLSCDEKSAASLRWSGNPQNVSFELGCPANLKTSATARVTVWISGVPVATILLEFEVVADTAVLSELKSKLTDAQVINSAFASYSRKDVDAVMGRIASMKRANRGMEVFVDVVDLKEKGWVDELLEKAVAFDAFFLFWSENASASEWVEQEWRKALEEKGLHFIEPMPLQPYDRAPPPKELKGLNFTDHYVILAEGMKRK